MYRSRAERRAREVRWYRLDNFQCSAENCKSKNKFNWVCNIDKSNIFLAQTGELSCCGDPWFDVPAHQGLICNWRFNCRNHGEAGFTRVDPERFTIALSQALQLMERAGSAWVAELIQNIGYQYQI